MKQGVTPGTEGMTPCTEGRMRTVTDGKRSAALLGFLKKRRAVLACVLLLAALIALLARSGGRSDRYIVEAEYDETAQQLRVHEVFKYTNRTGQTLDALCFNLWPNAYADEHDAPVADSELQFAYPEGFSAGGAEVTSVRAAGKEAGWRLEGKQRTLLRVQLPFRLRPTGSVEVALSYTVTLPRTRLRMGVSEQDVRLANVFATLCAFEDGGFRADGYSKLGDPFVSECADWQVTLTAPTAFVAAGAGLEEAGESIWRFRAQSLRDFALFLSKDYHVAQQDAEGVTVRSFAFTQEGAQLALETAVRALGVHEGLYGEYPYEDYTVCAGQFCIGGMEYPGISLIDDALYRSGDGMLEFVIAHETAHQWWYAGVGSDQIRAPWQDEALAEYSTLLYYEAVYGAESFDSLYQSMVRPATESASLRGVGVGQSLDKFESAATYDALVYRKGAAMLHDLRVSLGNDAFLTAMRRYYRDNLYTIAQPEDFFAALGSQGAQRAAQWLSGEMP